MSGLLKKILESRQEDIDMILDKISASGIDSLSNSELNILANSEGDTDKLDTDLDIDRDDEYFSDNGRFMFVLEDIKRMDGFIIFYGILSDNMGVEYTGCILFNDDDLSFFSCDFSDVKGNIIQDAISEKELEGLTNFISTLYIKKNTNK